jgi:aspartyl-tRNA(Asn)/glutamyl-tRNA(Gln) amidotransferase subunit B
MRDPIEAMEFLKVLRTQIRYTGASECSLEKGSMRVDANISIRTQGTCVLNTKVEVKNMNSIQHVGDAIAYELKRQSQCLDKNEPILLHTRLWDPEKQVTSPMRGKFSGPCVPDPTVPRIMIEDTWLSTIKAKLPEMPTLKVERFIASYGLTRDEALIMSQERELSEFFEKAVHDYFQPRKAVNWIIAHLVPALKDQEKSITESPLTPERFQALLCMQDQDEINTNAAKEVLLRMVSEDKSPEKIVEEQGFRQVSDTDALEIIVNRILTDNPSGIKEYQSGNMKVLGFFMGQAMKATQGKANPKVLKDLFIRKLS